ncbi:MAG: class I SAM-dependent methyltransferase [Bacteroidota bacterium]|jgi:predicted O-methyltransferase YrrM
MGSKLSKLFKVINAVMRKPYLLNAVLQTDDYWNEKIQAEFPEFSKGLPQITLTDLLTKEGREIAPISFLGGGSMVTDIALLKSLASTIPHCSYFEIGTWRGESVANVAPVADNCTTLNLSEAEMQRLGWPARYSQLHGYFSKKLSNVSHVFGDSKIFDFEGLNQQFDLVFIDGDHSHDYVVNDTQKVWEHLAKSNTIIVWHDYAHSPEQPRPEVLHGLLKATSNIHHHRLFHVTNTLCAIYLPHEWKVEIQPPVDELVEPAVHYTVTINTSGN